MNCLVTVSISHNNSRIAFFDFGGLLLDSHSRWLSFFITFKSVSVRALDKYDCPSNTELTLIRCIISLGQ